MKRTLPLSAAQTAGLCVLGGLIAAAGFLLRIPQHATRLHPAHSASPMPWAVAMFSTIVLGIALSLFANSNLGNGIAAGRWSDQEIESLRALLSSRRFKFLSIALLVLMVDFLLLDLLAHRGYSVYWAIFILSQSILWLRNTTRRQASNADPQPRWAHLVPLHFEHWGQQ